MDQGPSDAFYFLRRTGSLINCVVFYQSKALSYKTEIIGADESPAQPVAPPVAPAASTVPASAAAAIAAAPAIAALAKAAAVADSIPEPKLAGPAGESAVPDAAPPNGPTGLIANADVV